MVVDRRPDVLRETEAVVPALHLRAVVVVGQAHLRGVRAEVGFEVRRQLLLGVAEHRGVVVEHRDILDVAQRRKDRWLGELGGARHEKEANVAGSVLHLRVERRHPVADRLGPGDVAERMADGRVVFVDEDHDAFAVFRRVVLRRLARLVGERADRVAEIHGER